MSIQTSPVDFNLVIKDYVSENSSLHRHHYFELVHVLDGRGIHVINDNQFTYAKGDLFLLTPADRHTLQAHSASRFCIIDFTGALFTRNSPTGHNKPELGDFFRQLEYIFQNAGRYKGFIAMTNEDRAFCAQLIQRLAAEWETEVFFREIVLQSLVFLLLNILVRYARTQELPPGKKEPSPSAYALIDYLQHHIYESDKISLDGIASYFHLSTDYVGAYFRRQTGKTVRQFILDYKLELAKTRLRYSRLTVSEIAAELGFTDESHLNKLFRKKEGMTAKQFQSKKAQENPTHV